jgi:hypothetical protein
LLKTFTAIRDAMMVSNHDNSDPMTDYFDVSWYIAINVGKWASFPLLDGFDDGL